ncbi:phosphate/phosphite/phosphonate ABC transporter substrate-binding protein [bacterium]|nr:MAG: phosphate/phosphite/phosphonate ABC transporter substrate-binding protein [bacterium]
MLGEGLEPLAGEKRGSLGFQSAGGIAVKADSSIKRLEDLKGKRMVFGPMLAPTGYLAQYEMLLDAGIDPEVDLDYYAIPQGAYKHEKVVYGVWMGAYDAAAIPLLDLEIMEDLNKVGKGDLRIIAQSDPIPYCVFGVSSRVPVKIADTVRTVLINLTAEQTVPVNGEVVSILKAAQVDGFVPIEDSDFDRVREMARKTNMPPYQVY